MVRFGLRRSKNQGGDDSVGLNSIPTAQRKNTTAVAASVGKIEAAALDDGPVVAGGPISPQSNSKAAGLLRKMKRDKSPPPAKREDFSMASGSTWTTKATELYSTTQNMHADAAGNPVAPPNYNIDVRDDNDGADGRGGAIRRKFNGKAGALGGNKTDNTNISLVYTSHGPQASQLLNLVLRENLPVPKLPTDVIVQVEVSTHGLPDHDENGLHGIMVYYHSFTLSLSR